jgi:hypothetical protein
MNQATSGENGDRDRACNENERPDCLWIAPLVEAMVFDRTREAFVNHESHLRREVQEAEVAGAHDVEVEGWVCRS